MLCLWSWSEMVAIHSFVCQQGCTALMWAIKHGALDIVELLLDSGAKINAQNNVRSIHNDESVV